MKIVTKSVLTILAMAICSTMVLAEEANPSLLEARRDKSNAHLNMLVNRHMDELFNTENIPSSGTAAPLLSAENPLKPNFNYTYKDQSRSFEDYLERGRVNAILILKDNKIVFEKYRNYSTKDSRFVAHSMSKSIVSLLIGKAISSGKIKSVDSLVTEYLPDLKGTAYDKVTIKNVLMMRTGTSWKEVYTEGSELYKHRDASLNSEKAYYEDFAKKIKQITPLGTEFNYSTLDTGILGMILERVTGKTLAAYASEELWVPAGMQSDAYWVLQGPTGKQRAFAGAGLNATLRDFGRIGLMVMNNGAANGKQIVSPQWIKESTTRETPKSSYMYQWWPVGDKDAFAAEGVYGQGIYIQPSTKTVMVVLSYWKDADDADQWIEQEAVFNAVADQLK